jgi:hypothetical protein
MFTIKLAPSSSRFRGLTIVKRHLNKNIPTRPVQSPKAAIVKIDDKTVQHLERLSLV